MKNAVIIIVAVVFVLTLCPSLYAQQQTSFRCGNMFVKEGASSVAVQASCGEPISKEDLGYRGGKKRKKGAGKKVEKWVYGPQSGYYYVIMIEGGTVVSVEAEKSP
jgi:uncharacterized protein YxeA